MATMTICLQRFGVGPWTFGNVSSEEGFSNIILEFQQASNFFNVKVMSREMSTVLCSFTLRGVTGQDFSFVSGVQGSVSDLSVKLMLELSQITYVDYDLQSAVAQVRGERNQDDSGVKELHRGCQARNNASNQRNLVERKLRCHLVTLLVDPVDAGNLKDMVLHSTSCVLDVPSIDPQASLQLSTGPPQWDEDIDGPVHVGKRGLGRNVYDSVSISRRSLTQAKESTHNLHLIPTLPFWVVFIPWWLYCKSLRRLMQISITLYVAFSVFWALWQLHRHFYLIQALLAPILAFAKLYLAPLVTSMDYLLSCFTSWWYQFINPAYILLGIFFSPLITFIKVIWMFLRPIVTSQLVSSVFMPLLNVLWKPFKLLVLIVQKSRLNLASLDVVRLQLSIAMNVVIGSTKSLWFGFLRLFRYSKDMQKQKQALKGQLNESQLLSSHNIRRRSRHVT